ncbi:MAG: hypothetical protein GX895_10785 [Clostridiales bacterium]|nr:hypothetical protein [Clostridiales bacterium]
MKLWKKFFVFIIVAVVLQLSFLVFLNNYKLKSLQAFSSEDIKLQTKEDSVPKVLVPDSVDEIKSSYNGEFSAYYNNYSLLVINAQMGIRKKLEFGSNNVINIYKWHPNKNKIVVAQQSQAEGGSSLKLIAYDADLEIREDIKDLSWLGNNILIEDLDFIGDSDLVVNIAYADNKNELYLVGDEVNKLTTVTNSIGYIKYTGQDDKVLYEDKKSGKYYVTGSKKEISLDNLKGKVINIDKYGNIYIAEEEGRSISYIYYRNLFDEKSSWKPIEVGMFNSIDNIYVNSQGKIYIDNPQSKEFINLMEKRSLKYKGKLVGVYNEGIFVINDNYLIKKEFKDLKNSEEK